MTRLTMFCGLLLTTCFLSGPVFAGAHESATEAGSGQPHGKQHGGHHYGGPGGMGDSMGMWSRMGDKLGMSDTQKQELASLLEIYRPRFKELGERGEQQRKELLAMAPDDPGYGALTDSVSEEAGRAAAEVVVLMAELQANAYGLLTPEQQAEYMELRSTLRERMQARFKGMGQGYRGRKMHHGGHHGKHADGEVCEHGEDGSCPHHPEGAEDTGE